VNRSAVLRAGVGLFLAIGADVARAEGPAASVGSLGAAEEKDRDIPRQKLIVATRRKSYFDLFSTIMFGDGLRFNNPYRLRHDLGARGRSLSTTAPYLDVAFGAATGEPNGIHHGVRLGWSVSLNGVPQQVFTPAYVALLRLAPTWQVHGWAGLPILAEPDFNVGGELAIGGSWLARAGLGASAALVGDAFYGAGTAETRAAFYPVLSAQLGVFVNYEVLP
jgi:hypothetical protein